MDSFSVAIWVKIETSAAGGVIWDMECKNCIDRCPASVRLVATKQGAHVLIPYARLYYERYITDGP